MHQSSAATGPSDVRSFVGFVRRRWLLIVGCVALLTTAAFVRASLQDPVYEASATVLFVKDSVGSTLDGRTANLAGTGIPGSEMQTNLQLITQRPVAQAVQEEFASSLTPAELRSKISTEQKGFSALVAITAQDGDPQRAADLATTWASVFIKFEAEQQREGTQTAIDVVRRQLRDVDAKAQRTVLTRRLEQLETLNAVQTGTAKLTESAAVPAAPVSPNQKLSALGGLFLGLLLGFALALAREQLDRRLKTVEDVVRAFDLPLLGAVPQSRELAAESGAELSFSNAEAFAMLRANLRYFNVSREIKLVLITSGAQVEGKSVTSWQLGVAAARAGTRVLLVEADLRRPVMATRLGLQDGPGLSLVLAHEATLADAVQSVTVRLTAAASQSANGASSHRSVDVLVAGHVPPNPAELMESVALKNLLSEVRDGYDLVVVDTPPLLALPDAIPLLDLVDGVILIARLRTATKDTAAQLRDRLTNLRANVLGLVITFVDERQSPYGYGNYYDTKPAHAEPGRRFSLR